MAVGEIWFSLFPVQAGMVAQQWWDESQVTAFVS